MKKSRNLLIGCTLVLILSAGCSTDNTNNTSSMSTSSISTSGNISESTANGVTDEDHKQAVISQVEEFGKSLQMVSLLAPADVLQKSIQDNYSRYVTADLLAKFQSDPLNAPGRLTSSPWPDRIEVLSAEKISEDLYKVEGKIVEVTTAGETNDTVINRPITLEVKNMDGQWLISSVTLGEYETNDSILYRNADYGFSFTLPKSWDGYAIVNDAWEGVSLEGSTSGQITENGPKLLIRHPQWTPVNPRQDIPILVFTIAQWNLVQQEQLSVGAAPIPPSELGRNSVYVFALPARYNYAFPAGFEEVEQIMAAKPLTPFEL